MMILEIYECEVGKWPNVKWIVPAGWWARSAEGKWWYLCRIRWWQAWRILLIFRQGYWPLRIKCNGLTVWQSDGAKGVDDEPNRPRQ